MHLTGITIETYRECAICTDIINKKDKSIYLWGSDEKLVNVCRKCAEKLLKSGERIIGIKKSKDWQKMLESIEARRVR